MLLKTAVIQYNAKHFEYDQKKKKKEKLEGKTDHLLLIRKIISQLEH